MVAYPYSVPFSRDAARELCERGATFLAVRGSFLCFVMIPEEERIGEWRFAGTAETLPDAVDAIESYMHEMELNPEGVTSPALLWLNASAMAVWTDLKDAWSYCSLPLDLIGEHRVVLFVEGQAPYDDCGFCILEVKALADSPFARRVPQTERPQTWPDKSAQEP